MSEFIPIKLLARDDKPREKLNTKGKAVLSNTELLAILISTGTTKKSAIDLAREILSKTNNDLNELARWSVKDLCKIDGIGPAKAITIIAAMELGGRKQQFTTVEKPKVKSSKDAYNLLRHSLQDLPHEEFWLMALSRSGMVISSRKVSEGGIAGTMVDPKRIFKSALDDMASGIIVFHNHPSGNLTPSEQDKQLTVKIREAGKLLDINVMDHLIIAGSSYFSFADEGLL
ncbi:MAG: DNA repair protein RadC [Bacteroidota bacterium]